MTLQTLGSRLATSLIVQKVFGETWPCVYIRGSQKCLGEPELLITAQIYPVLTKKSFYYQSGAIGNEKGSDSATWTVCWFLTWAVCRVP